MFINWLLSSLQPKNKAMHKYATTLWVYANNQPKSMLEKCMRTRNSHNQTGSKPEDVNTQYSRPPMQHLTL